MTFRQVPWLLGSAPPLAIWGAEPKLLLETHIQRAQQSPLAGHDWTTYTEALLVHFGNP